MVVMAIHRGTHWLTLFTVTNSQFDGTKKFFLVSDIIPISGL